MRKLRRSKRPSNARNRDPVSGKRGDDPMQLKAAAASGAVLGTPGGETTIASPENALTDRL
jgi:propanediol dehydratase large subunit